MCTPQGLKERFKQTSNKEEALGELLEASNVECRVRSRARLASTLEEALDLLFVGGESGDEEHGDDINFNDLEDEQLFCDSEAEETKNRMTEAERRQVGPRAGSSQDIVSPPGLNDDVAGGSTKEFRQQESSKTKSDESGTSFKRGRQTSQEESSEDEIERQVRELNR